MGARTNISWTDRTWNPVSGCTPVSPGCDHCYAMTLAERFRGTPGHYYEDGFDVVLRPEKLPVPLRWSKPSRIFVNSMSDLFHDDIPDEYIAKVFAAMAMAPQHTFQLLTKRHGRMRSLLSDPAFAGMVAGLAPTINEIAPHRDYLIGFLGMWPLPNVWLGVTVENQQWADIRIPALLQTPAVRRFLSMEPLIAPVDLHGPVDPGGGRSKLTYWLTGKPTWGAPTPTPPGGLMMSPLQVGPKIDWVIVGGESGHGARLMEESWATLLRDQCVESGTPFLFKQAGVELAARWNIPGKGEDPTLWPIEFPQQWPTVHEKHAAVLDLIESRQNTDARTPAKKKTSRLKSAISGLSGTGKSGKPEDGALS